jgi:hypothetical protein
VSALKRSSGGSETEPTFPSPRNQHTGNQLRHRQLRRGFPLDEGARPSPKWIHAFVASRAEPAATPDQVRGRLSAENATPALWRRSFARAGRTRDQQDAYTITAWLSPADRDGRLAAALRPGLTADERAVARVEGWMLRVM